MSKVKMIKAGLLGSSSALGLNWIYDKKLLADYSKKNEVLFVAIDHELYKKAKAGFDVYPNSKVGDLDFMGETLYLFHHFLENNDDISPKNWRKTVYNYIKDDGSYNMYIEKYGIELISRYEKEIKHNLKEEIYTDYQDNQLVGLAMFTAIYENETFKNKVEDSLNYAKVLTSFNANSSFTNLLYHLFNDLTSGVEKEEALRKNIKFAPFIYQDKLTHSLHKVDSEFFIKNFSGVACEISQAFPLIYHLVAHNNTWEEAMTKNVILGGASSARGILISAIFNIIDGIPDKYIDKLNVKL